MVESKSLDYSTAGFTHLGLSTDFYFPDLNLGFSTLVLFFGF